MLSEETHSSSGLLVLAESSTAHYDWNQSSIPELASFCVDQRRPSPEDFKTSADTDGEDVDDEEESEEDEPQAPCLYCSDVLRPESEFDSHVQRAHRCNFRDELKRHASTIQSEYDLIRCINYVRQCVLVDKCCPTCSLVLPTCELLSVHIADEGHFLPVTVPDDSFLIPRVAADPIISYLMGCELFPDDDEQEEQ
jgi:hypothetical protein